MMNQHDESTCPRHEDAALHALGALEPADVADFESQHLPHCEKCRAELTELIRTAAALGALAPEAEPPSSLRARLLERIGSSATPVARLAERLAGPGEGRSVSDDLAIVRSSDGVWQDTSVPGVRVRSLFVDEAHDRITMLVRMDRGASYPAHRHGGVEECYVLEGDLCGPTFEMKAGDYQRLDRGSEHGVQYTREGCLLFIVSSLHDEMLGALA